MRNTVAQGALTASINQIGNCFGLGQVDAGVEESATAEFPRLSQSRAFCHRQADYPSHQVSPAMAVQLGDILAGQRPRTRHDYAHRTIEYAPVPRVADLA